MIDTIYVDMDGVISDWVYGVSERGYSLNQMMTDENYRSRFEHQEYRNGFFLSLRQLEGIKLFAHIFETYPDCKVGVLTSTGGGIFHRSVSADKFTWLRRNVSSKYLTKMTYNPVESSEDKAKFAAPNTLLIDDRLKSTQPFKSAGGNVILHKTYNQTITELKKIINKK